MKTKHRCRTYFKISGDFKPESIINVLGIEPSSIKRKGDQFTRLNQKRTYEFTTLEIGNNEEYNVEVDVMIEKTIYELKTKVKELKELKIKYPDIGYILEVVPEITPNLDEPNPYLSPTKEIMKFLVEIDAEYDIDYYIYEEDYYWSGKVYYEIKINDTHVGYEEVIQLIKYDSGDPLLKLEKIAKSKDVSYLNKLGEKVDIKVFKIKEIYAIHDQNSNDSFEVYANSMPATEDELNKYLETAYNLEEDESKKVIVSPGARIDQKRR